MAYAFPTSQRELLIAARGGATQAEFAKRLGVDRSCLSRYETEQLGAPTSVLNYCLKAVAELHLGVENGSGVQLALAHVRRAADTLEQAAKNEAQRFATKRVRPASRS
ncbi:transcriptional regulator [Lysobacter auxotrophicus]|uniref:Transcriptional regulator n=1 Tax=Lysobacter auxotrophicus TaxID=2992573 RepID=A0ABN6UNX4_9GAMM|nr:transcriptional regulator [Lysobacter auxotrophicus]